MVAIQCIYNLFDYYKNWDHSKIDKLILDLIKKEEVKWNYIVAKKLRSIYSKPYISNDKASLIKPSWSTNHESRLFLIRKSKITSKSIVLSTDNQKVYNEILENFKNKDLFRKHNVDFGNKVLLYGPPWTWKTMLAYAMAGDLNLPIMHINLDSLISSYLWETGKNIKQVFDEANSGGHIIFLDEFDAIGKQRDDNNELWELKRVVTVLLQNIDMMNPNNILLASTNHYHLLDIAILRRFDYKINLGHLDLKGTDKLLHLFLSEYDINISRISSLVIGMSWAQIKQLIDKALRKFILWKFNNLESSLINELWLFRLKEKTYNIKNQDDRDNIIDIIKKLREIDSKTFTYDKLEDITSIPRSTLNSLIK